MGAPWFNATSQTLDEALQKARTNHHTGGPTLRTSASLLDDHYVDTPFLYSAVLVRRELVTNLGFDTGYRGNSWREETDFFLRAYASGARVVRSCGTFSYLARRYPGGHSRSMLRYEYWVARNEVRFLWRNRSILAACEPDWKGVPIEVAKSILPRWGAIAKFRIKAIRGKR